MNATTAAAVAIARGAGAILADAYGRERRISHKGMIDLVTSADHASEAYVLAEIERRFPEHAILSEEAGARRRDGPYRWVVDPLDGTVNFAHGLPHFAVLIAVEERLPDGGWEPTSAVTLDPLRDELFVAERGAGTTLNGIPVHVAATERLIDAVLATGFGYDRLFATVDNHAEFCRLNLLSQGVRRCGSAGLDLAYVACGRIDAFWEYHLHPWDVAAGRLLITEAGGCITGIDGVAIDAVRPSVAAASAKLHEPLLAALRSARQHPINARDGLAEHLPADIAAQLQRRQSG